VKPYRGPCQWENEELLKNLALILFKFCPESYLVFKLNRGDNSTVSIKLEPEFSWLLFIDKEKVLSAAHKVHQFMGHENICSLLVTHIYVLVNLKLHTPPPLGIWTFDNWLVQFPSCRGKKAVQMPNQLILKCLSSKTNFVFNQTLFTLFRERYAEMIPSNVF